LHENVFECFGAFKKRVTFVCMKEKAKEVLLEELAHTAFVINIVWNY
jgi:hypothetical protein